MRVVIIEDEKLMSKDLSLTLQKIDSGIEVLAILPSVEEALEYFRESREIDLIFSDIELEDGLSFEIFEQIAVNVPVIFCTAYDEYALQAFRANGLEYIVKPFSYSTIQKSLEKFENLKQSLQRSIYNQYLASKEALEKYRNKDNNVFVIKYRNQILPISFDKIALIYIEDEITYVYTHHQRSYAVPYTLDEMEKKAGEDFYRGNRQFLINRNAVKELVNHFNRKLLITLNIPFHRDIIISKDRTSKFLKWLEDN